MGEPPGQPGPGGDGALDQRRRTRRRAGEHIEDRRRARIAPRVEKMPEPRQILVAGEVRRHYRQRIAAAREFVKESFGAGRSAAVTPSRKRSQHRRHQGIGVAPVETTQRATKVAALSSWSAIRTRHRSAVSPSVRSRCHAAASPRWIGTGEGGATATQPASARRIRGTDERLELGDTAGRSDSAHWATMIADPETWIVRPRQLNLGPPSARLHRSHGVAAARLRSAELSSPRRQPRRLVRPLGTRGRRSSGRCSQRRGGSPPACRIASNGREAMRPAISAILVL